MKRNERTGTNSSKSTKKLLDPSACPLPFFFAVLFCRVLGQCTLHVGKPRAPGVRAHEIVYFCARYVLPKFIFVFVRYGTADISRTNDPAANGHTYVNITKTKRDQASQKNVIRESVKINTKTDTKLPHHNFTLHSLSTTILPLIDHAFLRPASAAGPPRSPGCP